MADVLFYLFAALTVAGALAVPLARNPVRGALGLVGSLFSLAVIFIMLDAHLLAALEVLVYAGAVMVLFLFVIMLLNLREEELGPRRFTLLKGVGVLATCWMGAMIVGVVQKSGAAFRPAGEEYGTVLALGRVMFRDYLLPFEMTSILLLAAVVGAVVLAKRRV